MKNKIFALGAGLMMLTAWSCREESDVLMTYDHDDALVFNTAKNSFADKFQLMWDGMNQYYTLWDYEAENGLDWDAIYDEYYPQFAALDQRGENETVTDDELMTLMGKVLGQLHDGHFHFDMMNHKTGSKVMCFPLKDKNAKRADFTQTASFRPNLTYFADPANNEIETDANGNPIYMEYSTNMLDVLGPFFNTPGIGYQWIEAKIQELEAAQVSRVKDEVAFIVLNGNYALEAGFSVAHDAVAYETSDSVAAQTYVNVLVVKAGNENNEGILALAEVLKSQEIKQYIIDTYDGAVVPFED